MLDVEHSFVFGAETSENRSEISEKFWNVVLEKYGDHWDRSCENWSRVKEERNILQTLRRKKANWIGHILCRNCLPKHVTEGKVYGRTETRRWSGRRRKQLLDDLKEKTCCWKLKEDKSHRAVWRIRIGKVFGPVVRHTTEWIIYI